MRLIGVLVGYLRFGSVQLAQDGDLGFSHASGQIGVLSAVVCSFQHYACLFLKTIVSGAVPNPADALYISNINIANIFAPETRFSMSGYIAAQRAPRAFLNSSTLLLLTTCSGSLFRGGITLLVKNSPRLKPCCCAAVLHYALWYPYL